MIDVKRAVQIAKEKATELLGQAVYELEEVERESYKDRDVWSITISWPRDNPELLSKISLLTQFSIGARNYKRFLIDAETADLVAMQIREVATQ